MDHIPHEDALVANHPFPGTYQIKAIGSNADDFAGRVVAAALSELAGPSELDHSVRQTKGGRHVAVTLDLTVQSPEQVRAVYAALRRVEGLSLLL